MRTDNTLHRTKDYGLFELHPCNRPLHDNPTLMASMKAHGFMPSSPIQVVRNGNGKLKIIRGHHRYETAKRLGIPIYYVIDNSVTDLFELEGPSSQLWNSSDHAAARARSGNADYIALLEFQAKHGLTMGAAASLIGGESAGSTNKITDVKTGTFKAAADQSHARQVVTITDYCYEKGITFARSSAFVSAVSMVVRVAEFDSAVFLHRVDLYGANLNKRSRVDQYLDEIEALYNYMAKARRLPLAHLAKEEAKRRQIGRPKVRK